jgi:PPOX class probable F420-dependent enzyme
MSLEGTSVMSVIPEGYEEIFTKRAFAHVATLGKNGEPQSSPVWVDWDGECVRFSLTTTRQKYRNLKRDARIAVSATDPDNTYRYLEVRGSVERIEDDEGDAFINSMAKKYLDKDVYPWPQPGDHRVVVYVRPEHTSSM